MSRYNIHTDGAYSRMRDEGAFAYIVCDGDNNELFRQGYKITHETNQRAELKAIIAAVYKLPTDADYVEIHSDSRYALNTLSGKWSRNANTDLFEAWERVLKSRPDLKIEYTWVKGHNGDYFNEECDKICNETLGYNANAEFQKYK